MIRNILRTFALMFLLSSATLAQVVHYGVCVGINDYPGTINDLQYCVNDAQQILYRLRDYQGWALANLVLKTDAQATKTNILNAVSAMPRTSSYSDLFHYSGHGDYSGIWVVDQTDLSPSDLQSAFGSSYYQYASYLDACHSGIFPRDMTHGVISSACTVDEVSWEFPALQHGVFSYYLIQGLTNNVAGGSDGIVTAEELHNYATPRTTRDLAEKWIPEECGAEFHGETYEGHREQIFSRCFSVNFSVAFCVILRKRGFRPSL